MMTGTAVMLHSFCVMCGTRGLLTTDNECQTKHHMSYCTTPGQICPWCTFPMRLSCMDLPVLQRVEQCSGATFVEALLYRIK